MPQQLDVAQSLPSRLMKEAGHKVTELSGGGPVGGEGDLLVLVAHDVGVGVDHGVGVQVGEGSVAVEHLEGEDAQAPVVALRAVTVVLAVATLDALEDLRRLTFILEKSVNFEKFACV